MEGGRQEERDDGGQQGGGTARGGGGGVKLQEARERSKNRRDLQRKMERRAGGRDRERERGQRGQEGKGVINEWRAVRSKDEKGEIERVRGCEGEKDRV